MAPATHETVFQGEIQMAKCLPPPSEMVQRWKLGRVWQNVLNKHKHLLDMSSIQLDGTNTQVKCGGQASAYQGRKKSRTINMLVLTDSRETPLACSDPIEGIQNDAFNLVPTVEKMIDSIQSSGIATDGLFLNTDAEFDV